MTTMRKNRGERVAALLSVLAIAACSGAGDAALGGGDALSPEETGQAEGAPPATEDAIPTPALEALAAAGRAPGGGRGGRSGGEDASPEDASGQPPVEPAGPAPSVPMPYRGVNLAGAEFGSALPGKDGVDYTFPTPSEVDYFRSKGLNTFRVGFKWERLQRAAYGGFDAAYLARLDAIVTYATSKGSYVILNPHNFARYYGATVGSTKVPSGAFADLWKRLAARYKANARVLFNLVNEPHTMPTEQWVGAANAAIAAIRAEGASNLVIAPGNGWTGAHSWASSYYGTPNTIAMLDVVDPGDNIVFEAHQYLDADSSGGGSSCVSGTIGRQRLAPFVSWLRKHGKRGFIGEFAGANNAGCNAAVKDMLAYMMESADVLVGWLWWSGGPWWGDYQFALDPKNGVDRPQMKLLLPFLPAPT